MNKICMIEYQGRCDANGRAVGHAPKVLTEYMQFIKDDNEVSFCVPDVIKNEIPDDILKSSDVKLLPHRIVMKGNASIAERIINKLHMFSNIKKAVRDNDADILWFFNVEYYLMLYLFLHKKPQKKVVCTLFLDGYHAACNDSLKNKITAGVKQWVFEQAQKKTDLIISAGINFKFKNCKYEYIPDYYYKPEIFDKYAKTEADISDGQGLHADDGTDTSDSNKKNIAVCVGTMGNNKQLEEMVDAFIRIGYPLKIAGRFYDSARLDALKVRAEKAGGLIEIDDCYPDKDEYLSLIGSAKYTVLPYSPVNYASQTSGVMQEAIFLDTVPVTYRAILTGNGIDGVMFDKWDDLSIEMLSDDTGEYIRGYKKLREDVYSEESVKKKFVSCFNSL